jgi:hypothetical protein
MNEDDFKAAIAGKDRKYDVSARQVSNGFALAGNIRYCTPGTDSVVLSQAIEAVAVTDADAAAAITKFLTTGTFA